MKKLMLVCLLMGLMLSITSTSACTAYVHPSYLTIPPPPPVQHYNPTHRHIGKVNVKQPKATPRRCHNKPKK